MLLHVPTPCIGVLAAKLPLLLQTVWSLPAEDVTSSLRINVVLVLLQMPELTVQTKRLSPIWRFVTDEVGLVGTTTLEPPDWTLHVPVPKLGEAAFRFALLKQLDRVVPAFETTLLFTTNRSLLSVQSLFFTVHVKVFVPWPRPVTPVLATPVWSIVAGLKLLQLPVPTTGTVAPNWALVLQTSKLEDTIAADGLSLTMSTKSIALHPFFCAVHWNVLRPNCKFVTLVLAALNTPILPEPEATLHWPVSPALGTAFKLPLVLQTLTSEPALVTKLLL